MAVRAYPYRVAVEHITPSPWRSAGDGTPLGDFLASWDYSSRLHLRRQVEINATGVIDLCGFAPAAQLALNVRYWPTSSMIRQTALHQPLPITVAGGLLTGEIEIEVAGTDLAGALVIETALVLVEAPATDERFVARRPGSILWRDEKSVRLEGSAGLLPVAPVSFKDQGLPEQAAWYVSVDSAEWGSAAMGNVLVLLNDDNVSVRRAMETPDEPTSAMLLDSLTVDFVCDLVGRALSDEEFPDTVPRFGRQAEMSTAALVHGLISSFLSMPAESNEEALKRLRGEWQRDPSKVRARAQSNLRYPGSGAA